MATPEPNEPAATDQQPNEPAPPDTEQDTAPEQQPEHQPEAHHLVMDAEAGRFDNTAGS